MNDSTNPEPKRHEIRKTVISDVGIDPYDGMVLADFLEGAKGWIEAFGGDPSKLFLDINVEDEDTATVSLWQQRLETDVEVAERVKREADAKAQQDRARREADRVTGQATISRESLRALVTVFEAHAGMDADAVREARKVLG